MFHAIDYSWGRPDPAAIKAAGVVLVARYLSHDTTGKNLSRAEAKALLDAGLGIVLNFEASATRANAGFKAGLDDGSFANQMADDLGAPKDVPIYYSVDTDPGLPVRPAVIAYFQGLKATGGRPVDAYGGAALLKTLRPLGLIRPGPSGWNSNARSWDHGPVDGSAVMVQRVDHQVHIAGTADNQFDVSDVPDPTKVGAWGLAHDTEENELNARQNILLEALFEQLIGGADKDHPPLNLADQIGWIGDAVLPGGYAERGKKPAYAQQILAVLGTMKPDGSPDPKAVADAVVANLGDSVAKEVADELAKRLAS